MKYCVMRSRKLKLTLTFLLAFLSVSASNDSQYNFYFTNISGESGLSQSEVKCILQDRWGFMWFGTRNRLNRYDGKSIKVFDCYDAVANKRNNNINSLFEDVDKSLWVGTDEGIFIYNPYSESFTFFDEKTADGEPIFCWIADIQPDSFGNIWIVVPAQGLFRYHFAEKKLYLYRFANNQPPNEGKPQSICIEQNGKIWAGTNGDGIFLYERSTDSFSQFLGDQNGETLLGEHIYTLCDYGEELVVGIHEGKLRKFHKLKNTLSDVNVPDVHYKIIRHVVCFDGELWVGTEAGLYVINELTGKTVHLYEDFMSDFTLSDNMVKKIYRDRENGIWIATHFGGINYLPRRGTPFEQYVPLSRSNSISSKRIHGLKEDADGRIWIGTEDGGVNLFDPATGIFKQFGRAQGADQLYKRGLGISVVDNQQIWIGFFKNGLDIIDIQSLKAKHYPGNLLGLNEASITSIIEDRFGNVWIGNVWGLFVAKKGSMKFEQVHEIGAVYVYDIFEDSDGLIWIAGMGMGVYQYNTKDKSVRHFGHDPQNTSGLSSNAVSSIMEDSKGNIWFSTDRGGICRYNKITNLFTTFSINEGLPDDVAYKILEDKHQNLWFGTNKGLVKFNPETLQIRVYTKNDGLPGNQFNYKSALASRSGKFYFGSLAGLIAFDPNKMRENTYIPPVFITKISSFNKELEIGAPNSPLKESIIHTKDLKLKHDFSNIAFDFSALSYVAPDANRYAYKMEGLDEDWTYTTNTQSASYAKLPPGKYVFRVKASNNDGVWNEKGNEIRIEVMSPWWLSGVALFMYVLFILSLVFFLIRWYLKKKEKQDKEQRRIFEIEKEKELYNSKLDLFTNVAHEIRTPLSLINGPVESMQDMNIADTEIKKNLDIISRNADRLLGLVNQLLDFRKIDKHKLSISFSLQNISSFLQDAVTQFESVAGKQGKDIRLFLPQEPVTAVVDKNEFLKIINNLISNAVKYSNEHIAIRLTTDNTYFTISIQNDGELIPAAFYEKIFEPFFRLDKDKDAPSGSGIGLSLVRSLAELHNGKISVETTSGLNDFILTLPLYQEKMIHITPSKHEEDFMDEEETLTQEKNNMEAVLVVEDNAEMLSFIVDKLKDVFAVETARNGKEALDVLEGKSIDIIVSDVMMPEMDGIELCRRLKENIEYSHIPIVLLTAKNDLAGKIEGLETGAEAYIEKPFSFHYLISQLTTLLNNRRREREAFIQKPSIAVQQMGMNKADEKFVEKVVHIITENLTEPNFTIDNIADAVFMSRSNLNRKIKALTGLTPIDFIRLIRLKKSAELIQTGEYRISEICYLVGINSSSYFIRLFQKQFGMTPKEFAKQQTNKIT